MMYSHEVLARAFPGLPASGMYVLTGGDLCQLVPDWADRLTAYFNDEVGDGFPNAMETMNSLIAAWKRVLADYDAAERSEDEIRQATEAEAKRIDDLVHRAIVRQQIEREQNEQPELL